MVAIAWYDVPRVYQDSNFRCTSARNLIYVDVANSSSHDPLVFDIKSKPRSDNE